MPYPVQWQKYFRATEEIDPSTCRWEKYPRLTLEKHDRIADADYTFTNLDEAKQACEKMLALCGGIVEESGGQRYTLRKKGPPKHSDQELMRLLIGRDDVRLFGALGNDLRQAWQKLRKQAATGDFTMSREGKRDLQSDTHVILDPEEHLSEQGRYKPPTLEQILSKNTTAYVKYCPGFFGSYKRVPSPLKQNIQGNVTKWVAENELQQFRHFFAFKLQFQVFHTKSFYNLPAWVK